MPDANDANEKKTATIKPVSPPPAALSQSDDNTQVTRRSFFSWLSLGWLAFVAATGGFYNDAPFLFPKCII